MYFKRLEIFGFKSFADKTTLNFEPGITAVVGPNGCGKSNVFDSIRWVLGEQSVKELRGSAMEDVIFNGTDKKHGLGFAEVSVTFSNESRALPIDYNEVTVTRRLFRSGESEYLLNKTAVRLKDINELFMGTGIGAEAYSLVQQGKVDLVVSAKPEERRMILDEASGITKYKAKRREALSKLADTDQNLLRINDIVVEVKRQISSLERQASKARKYKDEFVRLKNLEVQLARVQLNMAIQQREEILSRLEEYKSKELALSQEVAQFNDLLEHQGNLLEELEDSINQVTADEIKLDGQIDINNRQIGFNEERLLNIAETLKRLEENKAALSERARLQDEKIAEAAQVLATIDEVIEKNRQVCESHRAALSAIAETVNSSHEVIRTEEEKIMAITSSQVHIKNRLTDVMKEVQGCLARKRRLEIENTKVFGEKQEIDLKLQSISQQIVFSSQHLDELNALLKINLEALAQVQGQLAQLDQEIDELEKKRLFLKSQKEFIEKLSVQYQGIPDPIIEGRIITTSKPMEHHSGLIGKVKEVLEMDPERAKVLGGSLASDGRPLYEVICEAKFIELDPQQISAHIEELGVQIEAKINEKAEVMAKLAEQELAVKKINFDIQEQEKSFSIFQAQKNDVNGEANKLNEELAIVKSEFDEVTTSLATLKTTEDELILQLDTLNQDLSLSQIKIRENQDAIAAKAQEREQMTLLIAQAETEVASMEATKAGHFEKVTMLQETLDAAKAELSRIVVEAQELDGKKDQYVNEIVTLEEKIELLKEEKASLSGVLSGYVRQKEEASARLNSVRANISSYNQQMEAMRTSLHQEEMQVQEIAFQEKAIRDRLMQSYKIDIDTYVPETVASASTEGDAAPQAEAVAQTAPKEPTAELPQSVDIGELSIAIDRLRKRCDSFGSVNLVAIEEFDQLKERFEYLTKQQSDLLTAKDSLHQTITKINRQTRQMFMDTFTKVSEEFRIYYRMLFGGGEAQLVLLDPENVLESGIEIIARPPGKKLQNISLLSGGEKSLTAIALIFGVFKVNPSPFCVLDEIDAALDESNVGRFGYLLKDFAKIAQFIVITHNKKTMAVADVLYGITMQETGVSKLVSVKFKEQEATSSAEEVPAEV
ncbi:MAG: AAA family ATPase [Candidatus Omnitrophica bacterium]|nr:AAA family ATPase [Candidatus Omnitrophota bacterium]